MTKKLLFLIKKNPNYLFFLSVNFLREKLVQRFFSGCEYSVFPSLITILATRRCNYRCKGCSSASPLFTKNFKESKNKEISLEQIKKIIDEVAWFKPFIYLNGGEPFLRNDLFEIIKYVKEKKLVCALTTNGSFLNEKTVENLVSLKLDFLSVSLDGPEKFHDSARGRLGAYRKAVLGIQKLIKLKNKFKVSYPHIRIASIIYPENISNPQFIVKLANDLKVDEIGFGLLMYYPKKIIKLQKEFIDKYKTGGDQAIGLEIENNYRFDFSLEKYNFFLENIRKTSKIPVYFAYSENQFEKYFDPQIFPSADSKCLTPWNNLLIEPNGDLSICQGFIFGNVLKGNILKQWNNPRIREFRKLRAKTSFPACFRCNEGQKIRFR